MTRPLSPSPSCLPPHVYTRQLAVEIKSRNWHLDDGVSSGGCFDGASAALRLIMGPVVGFGLDLQPQLILAVLTGQRPVQWRGGRGPGRHKDHTRVENQLKRQHYPNKNINTPSA